MSIDVRLQRDETAAVGCGGEQPREPPFSAVAAGAIVGQSPALARVVRQIALVAPTDATVLILGETGTGKELVAQEIHRRSRRSRHPLVKVSCASVPRELYESEFFGHAKGAFTGAGKDCPGRFELADGGTLFLDEVGEIPSDLQGKLLRVLQEGEFERVGEAHTRRVDVRIIAATNHVLKDDVLAGRFRLDLYFRLNVFPIEIAPLRSRKQDLGPLARCFVARAAARLGCPQPPLTAADIEMLADYDWPGNVRELQNVIERATIVSHGRPLRFELPFGGTAPGQPDGTAPEQPAVAPLPRPILTEVEVRRFERANIEAALRQSHGKIAGRGGAAELLGVRATTLTSRIQKLGITVSRRRPT